MSAQPHIRTEIVPQRKLEFPSLLEVWKERELLMLLMLYSIKSKYRQTTIGVLWALVNPLISVGVFTFIFSGLAKIDTGDIPYPLFSLAALLPWQYFQFLINETTQSMLRGSHILSKVYVPRLTILLVSIGPGVLNFAIGSVLLVGMLIYFGYMPSLTLLAAVYFFGLGTLFAIACGLWLSVINVTYRDVTLIVPVIMQVLFYATPIVYPADMVPEKFQALYWLNPLSVIIEGFRASILGQPFPETIYLFTSAAIVALVLLPGLVVFNRLSQTMADRF
jgi:lipopolysaccharide transport system permease protein